MSRGTDGEVTIAGRAFTLGAVYAPRPGSYGRKSRPRRLLRHTADSLLPGGRVTVAVLPSGRRQLMGGLGGRAGRGQPGGRGAVSDPDEAALEAVLDELDAAADRVSRATFAVATLEEEAEEDPGAAAELAAAVGRLAAAEQWLGTLRRRRRELEDALDRLEVLRVQALRAGGR